MKVHVKIFFALLICLFSCITPSKVGKYLDRHPDYAADYAALHFPVKEKIVTQIQYKPANNTDIRASLDSASRASDELLSRLKSDSAKAVDSISKKCADLISPYIAEISKLRKQIKQCIPDTVIHETVKIQIDSVALYRVQQHAKTCEQENAALRSAITQLKNSRTRGWSLFGGLLAINTLILLFSGNLSFITKIFK